MKQLLFAVFTIVIGLSLTLNTYAQVKEKSEKKETPKEFQKENSSTSAQNIDAVTPINTICPVSKEDADPKVSYTYDGTTYAFCCNKCLKKFKADPEKYINRMKEDEKPIEKSKTESKD